MRTLQILGRSSYVKVRDRAAFEAWLHTLDCETELRTDTDPDVGELVAFVYGDTFEDPEEGYSAAQLQTLAQGGAVEADEPLTMFTLMEEWLEAFAEHLAPGWVGVVKEFGILFVDEKLDAMKGTRGAINADKELILFDDDDDFFTEETAEEGRVIGPSLVKTLGRFVTRPEG